MNIRCAGCGAAVCLPGAVGFRDICSSCDAWLHSCVNCRFLVNSQCTEPSAEKVRDLEGMNFCDWYRETDADFADKGKIESNREAAEDMWRKLTKK
ncbi:MAG: hypothetical protein PVJ01_01590 [Pseudomonadota bacterium]|jgi:hypothetical protein